VARLRADPLGELECSLIFPSRNRERVILLRGRKKEREKKGEGRRQKKEGEKEKREGKGGLPPLYLTSGCGPVWDHTWTFPDLAVVNILHLICQGVAAM